MTKFYAREMWNTKYGQTKEMYNKYTEDYKVWMKFGFTHHDDAEKRFDKNVDDGYEKNYDDWDGKTEFSWWKLIGNETNDPKKKKPLTKEQVQILEDHILTEVFPNPGPTKVWVEETLGCADKNEYDNCSGITEMRLLTAKQKKWIIWQLYCLKNGEYDKLSDAMKKLPKKMGLPLGQGGKNPYGDTYYGYRTG